jgi:hypothetical protein
MRSFLAGLILLISCATAALGQVEGFVESIGYNNAYRPDCWTPLVVNLRSTIGEARSYQLQVWQEDLDRDRVVFTKDITLSPSAQDKFQLYFIPRPTDGGLLPNPNELARALQVRICQPPKEGQRPEDARVIVDRLPVQFSIDNIERPNSFRDSDPGKRLVLWVGDSNSSLPTYDYVGAVGQTLNVQFVQVPLSELGENVLYYSAADAVLWMGANAEDLDKGGAKRLEALEQYVRFGGHLVVCQPVERGKIAAFAGMLPIDLKDAADNWLVEIRNRPAFDPALDVLPQLSAPRAHPVDGAARANNSPPRLPQNPGQRRGRGRGFVPNTDLQNSSESSDSSSRIATDDARWNLVKGPIQIAVAKQLKPDAIREPEMERWPLPSTGPTTGPATQPADVSKLPGTDYIVRRAYGLGAVTWVAQDLGNKSLTQARSQRWPYVWDKIFGWKNDTHVAADMGVDGSGNKNEGYFATINSPVDLGQSLLRGMDFQAKGAAYIFVAILFFVGYWIVAGPGTYLFLSNKKKRELNWFAFGFWAFVATALTLGVVRLLLRGSAEVRHQTIVRVAAGQPVYMHSRIGLYIPRDGYQNIELKETSHDTASFITPYNIPPVYESQTDFPAAQDYAIPVHDDPQPVRVQIPYRSTLKKLQARWVGDAPIAMIGDPRLVAAANGYIAGKITNQSGTDLKNVHVVFMHVTPTLTKDWVLMIPELPKGQTLDLKEEFNSLTENKGGPTQRKNVKDWLQNWSAKWYRKFTPTMLSPGANVGDDFNDDQRIDFLMMSLIGRLPPDRNTTVQNSGDDHQRIALWCRGGHDLDCSQAIAAGQLVILAEAKERDRPLPFPLEVDGTKVTGEGTILYQFVLPLDRTEMLKALEEK